MATITTSTAHNYTLTDLIQISGANESQYNDSFRIKSIPSSTTITVDLVTANGSATGTITCKIAPLGWTRVYSGTNKSVYRAPAGNRYYLRIDDTNAQYAVVSAYETMTDVDTGTNKMGDVYWKKSDASSTAIREWFLVGNDKTFYLFTSWDTTYHAGYAFGDINSLKAGDLYGTMLIGHNSTAPANPSYNQSFSYVSYASSNNIGHLLMRANTGVIGAVTFFKFAAPSTQMGYATGFPFPSQTDNGLHLYPVEVAEVTGSVLRGRMPGLYTPLESCNGYFASGDRTVVVGSRTYMAVKIYCYSGAGNCFLDITGDW